MTAGERRERALAAAEERMANYISPKRWDCGGPRDKAEAVVEAYERAFGPEACPQSQKPDGTHCDHSWSHDECCWCGRSWGESGCRVAVAEDPVRKAAREAVQTGGLPFSIERLAQALAKPAPPSLTEDERKALHAELSWLDGGMPPSGPNPFRSAGGSDHVKFSGALRSAREKLVAPTIGFKDDDEGGGPNARRG